MIIKIGVLALSMKDRIDICSALILSYRRELEVEITEHQDPSE